MGTTFIQSGRFPAPGGGGFDPLSLSPALWFDASDAATITSSGGAVSQWDDKSGNVRHMTQGTAGNKPTTGAATLNGLNVISFGADDWLTGTAFTPPSSVTILAVMRTSDASHVAISGTAGTQAAWVATISSSSTTVALALAIVSMRVDGAAATVGTRGQMYTALNGTHQITEQATGMNVWPLVSLNTHQSAFQFVGDFAELIICVTPSTTDRDACEAYLKAKWGTP